MSGRDSFLTPLCSAAALILAFIVLTTACGVKLGSGTGTNIAPNAPISASGSFTQGTSGIIGNVAIYHLGTGSYEVFLSAFTGPTNLSGILLVVNSSAGQVFSTPLTVSSGNEGYAFSVTEGTTFVLAAIYQTSTSSNLDQATLF
jgi:hypothetical protein